LVSVRPPVADAAAPQTPVLDSTGLAASVADECVVVPYNDLRALEQALTASSDIAAVFLEPVLHTPGCVLPETGYLQGVREMCTAHGVPLVFDEIITGFRHALRGYQSIAEVRPDLTALGKAMSNGLPISALTGRREILESLTPIGSAYYSGTFMGQNLLVEGALHTIAALQDDAVYQRLYKLGQIVDDAVSACIAEHGLPACFSRCGSVWALYFGIREVKNYRDVVKVGYPTDRLTQALRAFLRHEGFYFHPATTRAYLMDAHTEAEINRLADLITDFLLKNRNEIASAEASVT
jgi:glutamate-1-semialdehyde 2,1-aminomutase